MITIWKKDEKVRFNPLKLIKYIISLCFLLWFVGFCIFLDKVINYPIDEKTPSDAIIVFTGGSNRLKAGFNLLRENLAKNILISGVGKGVSDEDVRNEGQFDLKDYRVDLDHKARDTEENAVESAKWIRENNFKSIRLVTSNYHMDRSILVLKDILPDLIIIPHPIVPTEMMKKNWWYSTHLFSLILKEYNKLLVAHFRSALRKT